VEGVTARLGLVGFGILAGLVVLCGLELGLWVIGAGEGPPGYDPFAGFSTAVPLFERAERKDGTPIYRVSPARLDDRGLAEVPQPEREFLAEKPAGAFRAFVVGGSSAAGFPYPPEYAFSAWLGRRLRAALRDTPIEVVNAALSGYGSRRELVIVRELANYQPDLLIVYSGHNEWAESRYYSRLIDMGPRLFRLRERLFTTRLFTVVSRLRPFGDPDPEEALQRLVHDQNQEFIEMFAVFSRRVQGSDYASAAEIRQRDLLFRLNLEEIVLAARSTGARVMLLTLSQNFADWPPGASTHRPGFSGADESEWRASLEAGERAAADGACVPALEAYERALEIDDEFADLHHRIAECHRALGRMEAAREHYRRASDLDRVPHGAPTYFNEIIREVASESGLLFLDVDELLERESQDGLVGDDLFIEFAHPNLRAHQLIAEAVAEALRRAELPRPANLWIDDHFVDPTPESLYAANPELRLREHKAIRVVCALAGREGCVAEQEEALRGLQGSVRPGDRRVRP
jgi:tetratricopeptide (TPR) repeat protein